MRNLIIANAITLITLLFVSCNTSLKTGDSGRKGSDTSPPNSHIVEAQNMNLTNYEIADDGATTFIKLTDSAGVAKFNFPLITGTYDIDVKYLSESVGQNTYTMYINNNQIVAWLGKNRDDQWHMLSEQRWHAPKNIQINKGDEIKATIAARFIASFQNKLVMIRWPNTYNDDIYNFGYYWDSFAHIDQEYYAFHLNHTSPRWQTAPVGGETAYNWGNLQKQPGESPEESLTETVHRDYIIDKIRKLHANHVGWIANYDQSDEKVRAGAELVQKALGYRFVLKEVNYPKRIDTGTKFTVSFKVKNTGSSPFYYNWPVEVSLLDPNTKKPVWKKQCNDIDIRDWLPGDKWDESNDSYVIPAETYTMNQTFELSGVPSGEYILAFAILDPVGNLPCARFAIRNYYNGGRHPIGKVGMDKTIDAFSVSDFDNIQSDTSLFYEADKNE